MIVDPPTLLAFVLASLVVYVTPGVDMAYIASCSITQGRRGGLWAALGTIVGVSVQALLAGLGITAVFAASSPVVFDIVRWIGVAYLAWLGVRILTRSAEPDRVRQSLNPSPAALLTKGVAINLLNPKVALFFVAFLPQFIDTTAGAVSLQLATLGATFAVGSMLWCTFLALLFSHLGGRYGGSRQFRNWQRRVVGTAYLTFAGLLAGADLRR